MARERLKQRPHGLFEMLDIGCRRSLQFRPQAGAA
jgi:hypothetical protein